MENEDFHAERVKRDRSKLLIRRDNLIVEIKAIFKNVTRENGTSIREADVIDDYGTTQERDQARRLDTDTHWSEVDIELLDPGCSCLCFMDAIGYRYHLPAYMVYTLKNGYGQVFNEPFVDSNIFEFFIYGLDLSDRTPELLENAKNKHSLFTHEERTCIARFLAFDAELETHYECNTSLQALESEWAQYLPRDEYQHLQLTWSDAFS